MTVHKSRERVATDLCHHPLAPLFRLDPFHQTREMEKPFRETNHEFCMEEATKVVQNDKSVLVSVQRCLLEGPYRIEKQPEPRPSCRFPQHAPPRALRPSRVPRSLGLYTCFTKRDLLRRRDTKDLGTPPKTAVSPPKVRS